MQKLIKTFKVLLPLLLLVQGTLWAQNDNDNDNNKKKEIRICKNQIG
jgi:hypothetical protein